MSYALVDNGTIVAVRHPGRTEPKLSDGRPLGAPNGIWTDELAALCGFVPIVETDRPADTDTHTTDRTVEMVNGAPSVVWVSRPKTDDEKAPPPMSTEQKLVGALQGVTDPQLVTDLTAALLEALT